MDKQSNASARSTAEILAGLGATETTSPVLVALISPIVPITQQGVDEVWERFNDYLEEVNNVFKVVFKSFKKKNQKVLLKLSRNFSKTFLIRIS